ncbi:hypothetical protein KKG41_02895 [Patescibacteria group bacterium]|nr:hypothetical protein [Patescibacteria group bacterium]MBU1890778.1 hypothetical protein [Patescibacteria group bacterium]
MTMENGLLAPGKVILKRLTQSDKLLRKIEEVNKKEVPIMLRAATKLSGDKLAGLSGTKLLSLWNDWLEKFISMMRYSVLATVMEMEEPLLSNAVENILVKKLGKNNDKTGEYFQILSSSPRKTVALSEEIDLLKLRTIQLKEKLSEKAIEKHLRKYAWIGYGYNGPEWRVNDIKQRLNILPRQITAVLDLAREKREAGRKLQKRQSQIEKELKLNVAERRLVHTIRTLAFWKFERKFLNQKAHLLMEDFIREVAKRNHLSKIQACMIAPNELKDALLKENIKPDLMNERIKESVVVFKGVNYKVLSGKRGQKIFQEIRKSLSVDPNIKELNGNTAYPGTAKGIVRRVDEPADMKKMQQGDILVSTSTNPQIVPAMQKAGAIVTDSGGITCHAAIVSRELKVPCVIGTKIATKVFKDGDRVEVDASRGIVKKI